MILTIADVHGPIGTDIHPVRIVEPAAERVRIGTVSLDAIADEYKDRLRVVKLGQTSPLKFRQLDVARFLEASLTTGGSHHQFQP